MFSTTAAVVMERHGLFEIRELNLDSLRGDEVLVRIVACGICHTDLAIRDGDFPIPELPAVLGHEGAGYVEAVGGEVSHVKVGDPVVLTFAYCGDCDACKAGRPTQCVLFIPLNMQGARTDGTFVHSCDGRPVRGLFLGQSAFARHAIVNERSAVKIPEDAPLEILGPLGCAIQTGAGTILNVVKPDANASVVIFGAGAVGLAAVMGTKIAGCRKVVVVDLIEDRLALARELGATDTLNATNGNVAEAIHALLGGGADHIVEASGVGPAMEAAFAAIRYGGSVSIVGMPRTGTMITIPFAALMGASVATVSEGGSNPAEFIPRLVDYYKAGMLPIDKLIRFYDFEDINQASQDAGSGLVIKPVLLMDGLAT